MSSIASNFVVTLIITTLNNLLYRTMGLINPISSDLLEDPRIYAFLILKATEKTGNMGNFLGRHLVSPLSC